jgi:zinc protease
MILKKKHFFILKVLGAAWLFLILSAAGAFSQDQPGPSCAVSELTNGLTLILIPAPGARTATLLLTVQAGSLTEDRFSGKGISHLLEHLLFKSTEDNSETELAKRVQALGGYVNAHTGYTETQYYIELPSRNIEKGLAILSELIFQAQFNDEEFDKEKDVVLHEMDMNEDSPARALANAFFQEHYFSTPMAFPIIGLRYAFQTLTAEDVREYFKQAYQPSNMLLTVCGQFNEAVLKAKAEQLFGAKPGTRIFTRSFRDIARPVGSRSRNLAKPQIVSTKVMMGYKSCSLYESELYALDIAAEVLGGGQSSRLVQKLRDTNLVLSVSCSNYTPQYEGVFIIDYDTPLASDVQIREIIAREIDAMKKGAVSREEIQRAIQRASLDYATSLEKNSEKAYRYTDSYLLTGTFEFPRTYLENLRNVSPDDIARAASRFFVPDNMTIVTMRPETPAPEEQTPGPEEKTLTETLPELRTLKNGIRVILKGDESSFASSVCVYCKGGSSYEDNAHKGISFLTTEMLRKGTKRYSQKGLAEKVEMLGASLSPISGYNAVGMKLTVLNTSLQEAIPLLGEVIMSPSFPEKELSIVKERTRELIRKQQEEIFSFAVLEMRKRLFPGHPYGLSYYGTPETVDAITLGDCKAHWARVLTPSQIVISAAGNFDNEKIFSLFDKTFGSIRPQGAALKEESRPSAIIPGRFPEPFPAKQAAVLVGFHAPDYMSEEKYVYGFLDSFFSDQASPLFQSIRTEEGLAYATGSAYINGPLGGFFILYCATTPEKASQVE